MHKGGGYLLVDWRVDRAAFLRRVAVEHGVVPLADAPLAELRAELHHRRAVAAAQHEAFGRRVEPMDLRGVGIMIKQGAAEWGCCTSEQGLWGLLTRRTPAGRVCTVPSGAGHAYRRGARQLSLQRGAQRARPVAVNAHTRRLVHERDPLVHVK